MFYEVVNKNSVNCLNLFYFCIKWLFIEFIFYNNKSIRNDILKEFDYD